MWVAVSKFNLGEINEWGGLRKTAPLLCLVPGHHKFAKRADWQLDIVSGRITGVIGGGAPGAGCYRINPGAAIPLIEAQTGFVADVGNVLIAVFKGNLHRVQQGHIAIACRDVQRS